MSSRPKTRVVNLSDLPPEAQRIVLALLRAQEAAKRAQEAREAAA